MWRFTSAFVISGCSGSSGACVLGASSAAGILRESFSNCAGERRNVRLSQHRVVISGDFVDLHVVGEAGPAVVRIRQDAGIFFHGVKQNNFAGIRRGSISIERSEIRVVNLLETLEPAALRGID